MLFAGARTYAQYKIKEISFIGLENTNDRVVLNELDFELGNEVDKNVLDTLLKMQCEKLYNLQFKNG